MTKKPNSPLLHDVGKEALGYQIFKILLFDFSNLQKITTYS